MIIRETLFKTTTTTRKANEDQGDIKGNGREVGGSKKGGMKMCSRCGGQKETEWETGSFFRYAEWMPVPQSEGEAHQKGIETFLRLGPALTLYFCVDLPRDHDKDYGLAKRMF